MEPHPQPITPQALMLAAALFMSLVVALFIGSIAVPGPVQDGAPTGDGTRKQYKLNGLPLLGIVVFAVALAYRLGVWSLVTLYTHFFALLVVANLFAFALTFILYLQGRANGASRTDHALRHLFYGAELNPTWLGVDLKLFSYRPSLIGLCLINVTFAVVQYETYGWLTMRMWLYQLGFFLYIVNHFQFEHGLIYMWDMIAERFGWMLVWGDYVLVPFFYSLPGWYLVHNLEPLSIYWAICLILLYLLGFWLFRGANQQKHQYKLNPNVHIWGKPAESIGGKLLVSGFWGIGRKLNYTGELCLYCSWTLLCGFGSFVPYLLPLWLAALFVHRAWRDDRRCRTKYGQLWADYCRRARFRMIPFIY